MAPPGLSSPAACKYTIAASTRRCASSRLGRSSFVRTPRTCPSTVRSGRKSRPAMPPFVRPPARPLGEEGPPRDATVRQSLGHQRQHLALAPRQRSQRVLLAADQRGDDLRVECRPAGGDARGRVEEVRDVEDAVLEQVAEAALGGEPDGARQLDVLREHEHAHVRVCGADPARRADPLVGERRRHADVDDRQVRLVLAHRAAQAVGVVHGGGDLVPGVLEQAGQPVAKQRLVLCDHYSHGSSAVTTVPPPTALPTRRRPPSAATRSPSPTRPEPPSADAPPVPSSLIEITRSPLRRAALTVTAEARACFTAFVSASLATK